MACRHKVNLPVFEPMLVLGDINLLNSDLQVAKKDWLTRAAFFLGCSKDYFEASIVENIEDNIFTICSDMPMPCVDVEPFDEFMPSGHCLADDTANRFAEECIPDQMRGLAQKHQVELAELQPLIQLEVLDFSMKLQNAGLDSGSALLSNNQSNQEAFEIVDSDSVNWSVCHPQDRFQEKCLDYIYGLIDDMPSAKASSASSSISKSPEKDDESPLSSDKLSSLPSSTPGISQKDTPLSLNLKSEASQFRDDQLETPSCMELKEGDSTESIPIQSHPNLPQPNTSSIVVPFSQPVESSAVGVYQIVPKTPSMLNISSSTACATQPAALVNTPKSPATLHMADVSNNTLSISSQHFNNPIETVRNGMRPEQQIFAGELMPPIVESGAHDAPGRPQLERSEFLISRKFQQPGYTEKYNPEYQHNYKLRQHRGRAPARDDGTPYLTDEEWSNAYMSATARITNRVRRKFGFGELKCEHCQRYKEDGTIRIEAIEFLVNVSRCIDEDYIDLPSKWRSGSVDKN